MRIASAMLLLSSMAPGVAAAQEAPLACLQAELPATGPGFDGDPNACCLDYRPNPWSLDFDGNRIAIGAASVRERLDDPNEPNRLGGVVTTYHRNGRAWSYEGGVPARLPGRSWYSGYDVAVGGDQLAVGTVFVYHTTPEMWALQVYTRAQNAWALTHQSDPGSPWDWTAQAPWCAFGPDYFVNPLYIQPTPVTGPPDTSLNFDGVRLGTDPGAFVVGSEGDNELASRAGSVRTYLRTNGSWTASPKIFATDAAEDAYFGRSVALSGDWLAVGAPTWNWPWYPETGGPGAVYLFRRDGSSPTGWTEHVKLTCPDATGEYDSFGYSAALDGDLLAVGAWRIDTSAPRSGTVYLYQRNDSGTPGDHTDDTWDCLGRLTQPVPTEQAQFGREMNLVGRDLVVLAPNATTPGEAGPGVVYVYVLNPDPRDLDGDGITDECDACVECPADFNDDDAVNLQDLAILLQHYGEAAAGVPGDANGDGRVDLSDLAAVLASFGQACPCV